MRSGFAYQELANAIERPWPLIGTLREQCIADIGNSRDPPNERNALSCEFIWISCPVPFFVVCESDLGCELHQFGTAACKDIGTGSRVEFHLATVFPCAPHGA